MIENESVSTKERVDSQPDRDFLSDLPMSIIHMILGLIPFKDVVRTSILSKEWRYKWIHHLLPYLVLDNLTSSELRNILLDPPPSTFLFLRCLILRDISLSPDTIESLVANSRLLERLKIVECEASELRISAPNLKYLYLVGDYTHTKICIYAPLLAELDILFSHDYPTSRLQPCSVCHYTDFLGGFTNLEKLTADKYSVKYLSVGIESCDCTLVFPHLKEIELNDVNFEDIEELSVVVRLITGATNLELLTISTDTGNREEEADYASDSESPDVCFSDFGYDPDLFPKLRVVDMKIVSGYPSEAEFMVFLLERSPVLEKMWVDYSCASDDWEVLENRLLRCDWASPNVELLRF